MSFSIRSLSVLAYANGFTLWHYKAAPMPLCALSECGFFDDGADLLAAGDLIMVSGGDGARILCVSAGGNGRPSLVPLG